MDWNNQNNGYWGGQNNQQMNNQTPKPVIMNSLPVVNNTAKVQNNPQCIPGRVIHDVSEVAPNEVPMDNTYSTFVRDDYKEIYMKTWSSDGTQINTLRFVLADDQPQHQITQDNTQVILDRLDQIEKKISSMNSKRYYKSQQQKGENKNV